MTLPSEVEALALLGWRLYPASRSSKAARFAGATDRATHDLDVLARWHREFGASNWRVVMQGSEIWALDVDRPGADHAGDGFAWMAKRVGKHGALPIGPRTRSGGGGAALVFRDAGHPICRRTGWPVPGLDPRHGRLTITVPPSIHIRTRQPYRWERGRAPWECPLPTAPDWLLAAMKPPPERPVPPVRAFAASEIATRAYEGAVGRVEAASGGRNDTLNRSAFTLGRWIAAGHLSEDDCAAALYRAARAIGLDHAEARDTIRSGLRSGRRKPMVIVP